MSRHGYSVNGPCDVDELLASGRWAGMVASASRGRRGQKFFRDLVAALEAMPEKRLIAGSLEDEGEVCALGCLGRNRGIDLSKIEIEDYKALGAAFDINHRLAQEVMFQNDECLGPDPEDRWKHVHSWAKGNIK